MMDGVLLFSLAKDLTVIRQLLALFTEAYLLDQLRDETSAAARVRLEQAIVEVRRVRDPA